MAEENKCPCCGDCVIINNEDKRRESNEKLYKRYCECRDFEIRSFWQNSIFIWTFLAICYTAYGLLISNYFHKDATDVFKLFFPFVSSVVCAVGVLLSHLWYRMAKALKANFASYEMAIWEMESFDNFLHCDRNYLIHNYWTNNENNRLSSPSKIVQYIGRISIIIWFILLGFGIYLGIENNFQKLYDIIYKHLIYNGFALCDDKHLIWFYILGYTICILLIIWLIVLLVKPLKVNRLNCLIASSRYRTSEEERVFKHIRNDLKTTLYNDNLSNVTYFEIKEKQVSFFFRDMKTLAEWKKKLTEYFKRNANSDKDEKINLKVSFPYDKIKQFYDDPLNTMTDKEKEVFDYIKKDDAFKDSSSLQVCYVTIIDNTLSVTIKGTDYKNDMNKITDVITNYMEKKSKFKSFKVSYSL